MSDFNGRERREHPRIPFSTLVKMEFEEFSVFIEEYSHNISEGGIFIRTDLPKAVGSLVQLEFRLRDDFKLIKGIGQVVRVVEKEDAKKGESPGMGIKFLSLDAESKELIKKIIEINVLEGPPKPKSKGKKEDK